MKKPQVDTLGKSLSAVLQKYGPIEVRYADGKVDWLRDDDPKKLDVYGKSAEFLIGEKWIDRHGFHCLLYKSQRPRASIFWWVGIFLGFLMLCSWHFHVRPYTRNELIVVMVDIGIVIAFRLVFGIRRWR